LKIHSRFFFSLKFQSLITTPNHSKITKLNNRNQKTNQVSIPKKLLVMKYLSILYILSQSTSIIGNEPYKSNRKDLFATAQTSKILNFDKYLNLFSNCLIHLINYEEKLDFEDYGHPVVLSRYVYINPGVRSERKKPVIVQAELDDMDFKMNFSLLTRDTFEQIDRSGRYNWQCRAQYYLLPRDSFENGFPTFAMPESFENFWMR